MNLTELRSAARSVLEDPGGFKFTDDRVDRYARDAIQYLARQLGRTQSRLALNMAAGTQEYDLPVGVRKIVSLRLLPEEQNGFQPEATPPIQQVELNDLPITTNVGGEPRFFALNSAGGADGQNLSVFLWPVPDRTANNALVFTYDVSFEVTAEIPFTEDYNLSLVRLTAAGCLTENEDQTSIEKGEYLNGLAKRDIADMIDQGALNANDDLCRAFP